MRWCLAAGSVVLLAARSSEALPFGQHAVARGTLQACNRQPALCRCTRRASVPSETKSWPVRARPRISFHGPHRLQTNSRSPNPYSVDPQDLLSAGSETSAEEHRAAVDFSRGLAYPSAGIKKKSIEHSRLPILLRGSRLSLGRPL